MRAGRRRWWLVVGAVVAVGLVAGACGDGGTADDEAGVVRPSTTVAPAREEPTSSVAPPPSTTPTTDARPDPVYLDGVPQVTVTPSRAPAGAVVRLEGYGFTGDPWQTGGGSLWLSEAPTDRPEGPGDCDVFAEADHDITVTADGHLSGTFVVPARGECRFSTGEVDTGPLRYHLAYQCTACHIGTFTVILAGESAEEPAGTPCALTVTFGVQNFADEIYADGLSCAEAEAFLQDHARPLQPPDGAAHIDAEGFSCDRTGLSADALPPRANYTCTRDGQVIWFVRQ